MSFHTLRNLHKNIRIVDVVWYNVNNYKMVVITLLKFLNALVNGKEKNHKRFRRVFYLVLTVAISLGASMEIYANNFSVPMVIFAFCFVMTFFWAYYGVIALLRYAIEHNKLFPKYASILIITISLPLLCYFIILIIEGYNANAPLSNLNTDQWVNLFGGILGYIGSCLLGALALYQNDKQRIENKESQKQLEAANKRAEVISERLLKLEEAKYVPVVDIITLNMFHDDEQVNKDNRQMFSLSDNKANGNMSLIFDCKNVGEAYISKIEVVSIQMHKDSSITEYNSWTKIIGSSHINVGMKKVIAFESLIADCSDITEISLSLRLYNLLGENYNQKFDIVLDPENYRSDKYIAYAISDKAVYPPEKQL